MKTAGELLELYARAQSEAAFEELVGRYVDLVYSAALRRANGATQLAEDITQEVFTALAKKAGALPPGVQLGGWLHRHTGFVASTLLRSEMRRKHREMESIAMNAPSQLTNPEWNELAPLLDGAMDELETEERDALVLRFFERQDFRSVGAALGVSDDTAQKRVSRALDKLRELLLRRRDAVVPTAALALLLESSSVQSAPAALAGQITRRITESGAAAVTAGATAGASLATWLKVLLGAAAAAVIAALLILPKLQNQSAAAKKAELGQSASARSGQAASDLGAMADSNQPEPLAVADLATNTNQLRLIIVAADSGKPVPNVQIDHRWREGERFQNETLQSDRSGICNVPVQRARITELELTSQTDGFADTRLKWQPANGESIPGTYTLRLTRPQQIGGMVVDENGEPVADAKVGFNHNDDPVSDKGIQTHEFGWIQVKTDAQGKWTINRIAPELLPRIYGHASHPEHVESAMEFAARDEEGLKQLVAGTYVFHLGKAISVRGLVVNGDGEAIANASVLVGKRSMSDRRTGKSGPDGSFEIKGCRPGENLLTAEANGYSATTMSVSISEDSQPFRIALQHGAVLRMRVVSTQGKPIPNASLFLDTMHQRPVNAPDYNKIAVQAAFDGETDATGLLVWSNAPDSELDFDVSAKGYMRAHQVKVRPDGEEHTVKLTPALLLSGTVRDADSGEPIPSFRLVTGFPQKDWSVDPKNPEKATPTTKPYFPNISRYWENFTGGKFQKKIEESALFDTTNPGYMFKIEAEGYAAYVSRVIAADEGEVKLEVTLQKAQSTPVTVVLPDGTPDTSADVALIRAGARPQLTPNGFQRDNVSDPSLLLRTDSQGQFQFSGDPAIQKVIVAAREGYAEASPAALLEQPTITLLPWGSLEGTWTVGGKPASQRKLLPEFAEAQSSEPSFDFRTFQAQTDGNGHYVFNHVPPGKLKLIFLSYNPPNSFTHVPLNNSEAEIRAGETTTKDLGGQGYTVTAHLAWPPDTKPDKDWQCFGSVGTMPPQSVLDALGDPQKLAALKGSPEATDYMRTATRIQMLVKDAFTLVAEDVPSGDYMIMVNAMQHKQAGAPSAALMGYGAKITVPSEPATGDLDAGEIKLGAMPMAQR